MQNLEIISKLVQMIIEREEYITYSNHLCPHFVFGNVKLECKTNCKECAKLFFKERTKNLVNEHMKG